MATTSPNSNNKNVLLVTIRFKKRGLAANEFTVRLATTDFSDTYTVREMIDAGYKKLNENSLTASSFLLQIPQRLLGFGKYIGYNSKNVLVVYTEKDKGRISLNDIARHVLVHNEVIVVEYYDKNLLLGDFFILSSIKY